MMQGHGAAEHQVDAVDGGHDERLGWREGSPDQFPGGRTAIEMFGGGRFPAEHPGRIRSVVLDTGVLLNDLARSVRHQQITALIETAGIGSFRLLAADHVAREMGEKIPDYGARRGLNIDAMRQAWRRNYLPRIRFVTIDPASVDDPRLGPIVDRDSTDAPTAALAFLLAPCLALAEDPDLTDNGVGSPGWLQIVLSGRTVARHDQVLLTGLWGTQVTGTLATEGVRRLIRSRWGPLALLLAAAGVLGVLIQPAEVRDDLVRRGRGVLQRLGPVMDRVGAAMEARKVAATLLAEVVVPISAERTPLQTAAHVLSTMAEPQTDTELAKVMTAEGCEISRSALLRLMRRCSTFVEISPHRWQIGQRLEVA